jgi:hypothetical protein
MNKSEDALNDYRSALQIAVDEKHKAMLREKMAKVSGSASAAADSPASGEPTPDDPGREVLRAR